jgi:prolyl oligopeptidase
VAGIRGGDEYGEAWHRDGMLARKQNGFDDFIAAAEWLMAEGWVHPRRLAIKGGSNGGLLMGAMLTQRPDLFRCVVCSVPLLDMIRYPRFLIARYWIPEYGDPEREEDFRVLLAYSPYHRVRQGIDHPPVLVRTGLHDIRVDPMHARKFVARLQGNAAQRHPVLLYADRSSGHGSGKSVPDQILESTREWTWICHHLGLSAEAPEAPAP